MSARVKAVSEHDRTVPRIPHSTGEAQITVEIRCHQYQTNTIEWGTMLWTARANARTWSGVR